MKKYRPILSEDGDTGEQQLLIYLKTKSKVKAHIKACKIIAILNNNSIEKCIEILNSQEAIDLYQSMPVHLTPKHWAEFIKEKLTKNDVRKM